MKKLVNVKTLNKAVKRMDFKLHFCHSASLHFMAKVQLKNHRLSRRYWSEDTFWVEALEKYYKVRDGGQKEITLDIAFIEEFIFSDKTPAYKLMDAMRSVYELEGDHGCRGAPRLILALLSILQDAKESQK